MRHASFAVSDTKKIYASPRLPSRGFTTSNVIGATLPSLGPSASGRGQSPNVAKRTGWTTPRASSNASHPAGDDADTEYDDLDEYAESIKIIQQQRPAVSAKSAEVSPMESAMEILEAIARESQAQSELVRHRSWLIQRTDALYVSGVKEHEAQQLAYLEHMYTTIQLLQTDRAKERRRSGSTAGNNADVDTAAVTESFRTHTIGPSVTTALVRSAKRADMSPRLLQSPLRLRLGHSPTAAQESAQADLQSALERNADARMRARMLEKSAFERELAQRAEVAGDSLISSREHKLRETLSEKLHWQREYESMRDQVVEEKTRQVALFRRLDQSKREHLAQTEELERALRECNIEIELLRSQLAETQVRVVHQKRAMEELAKSAREEKERLVCSIAETRHKFKEWKEGEAGTLKAARDQAVHNLKTEYELKIARHHEEKQKLRDKVKDLEVSLRLLQKDRHLSPVELSLRKATILGSKEGGSTTEAELIEANSRIKELEALLNHAKEYQKRQEHIIRVSESTMARLMQEREVVALENLTLQPMGALSSAPLSLVKAIDPIDVAALGGGLTYTDLRSPTSTPLTTTASIAGEFGCDNTGASASASPSNGGRASVVAPLPQVPAKRNSHEGLSPKRRPSGQTASKYGSVALDTSGALLPVSSSADPEKEILRRQSIVLSAEVEKYRQIVVHSLDEIRALKDNRRRSHHGMLAAGQNGNVASLKEQYLMGEVIKLQAELEVMKTAQRKQERRAKKRGDTAGANDVSSDDDDDDSDSSSSSSSSDSNSDSEKDDGSGGSGGGGGDGPSRSSSASSDDAERMVSTESVDLKEGDDEEDEDEDEEKPEHGASSIENHAVAEAPRAPELATTTLALLGSTEPSPSVLSTAAEASETPPEKDAAVKVIQNKSKTFLMRRDFIKRRLAIDKIKARYRGYLVRKNVELLDRRHLTQFVVSTAMQYKMAIVQPHHEMTCKCHGLVLKLVIRVSKDPPIVQIQMTAADEPVAANEHALLTRFDARVHDNALEGTHVTYLHLFEIIALLPHEAESAVLETASEREIAATFASLLSVVRMGGQYRFAIRRTSERASGAVDPHEHIVQFSYFPSGASVLSELPVERIAEKTPTTPSSARETVDNARELEDLIRKARVPLADSAVPLDLTELQLSDSGRADHVHLKKFLRRLSSKNLDIIPESPRAKAPDALLPTFYN